MNCNCKWFEVIVAIVVFVLALWPALLGMEVSKWVIVVAAVVLFVHAFMCKNCGSCMSSDGMSMDKSMSSKPAMKKKKK
ncbi:MAG: hypothetical protein KC506_04005 [Nanoarchaeota archaeon]|nr:hypothetical protein [Nanoarchaeota archaeon]